MIRPRALRPGSRVALVAPAGPVGADALERAQQRVRTLGWEPVLGVHAAGRSGYLSAPDDHRLADFDAAMVSPGIDAIWCLRGGYGTMRIMGRIDLSPLLGRPRPLIGFSDNTVLHLIMGRIGLISFHGPHPAASDLTEFSLDQLRGTLTEPRPVGVLPLPADMPHRPETIVGGSATGRLVGGNLSLLAATVGTDAEVDTRGMILVVEEVGEPLYRIDRMLTQLLKARALEGLAGIAVGAINERPDAGNPDLPSLAELLADRLADLRVPLVHGFPFGHVPDNWTLPMGARATLDADAGTLEILEPAVED